MSECESREGGEGYELLLVETDVAQRLRRAADAYNMTHPDAATMAIEKALHHHEEYDDGRHGYPLSQP